MAVNQNERPIPGCRIMSKDSFWALIEEVKNSCGQDMERYMDMLKARLKERGAEYAQDFHNVVNAYKVLAYKYGLWSAAGLMGHATDDGFTDFRAWLISQGKGAYFAALKDPDSLAELDPGDGNWFESFSYAGCDALEDLTGEDAYDNMSKATQSRITEALQGDIEYCKWINYPFQGYEMPDYFPRLCQKYPYEYSDWGMASDRIIAAREAGLPPKPEQGNNLEMGGM